MVVLKDAELAWEVVLQLLLFLPACVLGLSHYWRHGKVTAVFAWLLCWALSFNSSLTVEGMVSLASVLGLSQSTAPWRWLYSELDCYASHRCISYLLLAVGFVCWRCHPSPGFVVSDWTMCLCPPSGLAIPGCLAAIYTLYRLFWLRWIEGGRFNACISSVACLLWLRFWCSCISPATLLK